MDKSSIFSNLKKLNLKPYLVFPIITLTTLLQFCAPTATKTMTTAGYEEDLSIYREESVTESEEVAEESATKESEVIVKTNVEPTHGISAELDSVTNIIIDSRKDILALDGFTIQIYSGNDRNKANELRRAAYDLLEDTKPSLTYDQPNYKVKIGEYYSRIEANEDYNILKATFSRAVLVPTKIRIEE